MAARKVFLTSAIFSLVAALPFLGNQLQQRWDDYASLCSSSYIASLVENFSDLDTVYYDPSNITANVVQYYSVMANPGGPMYLSGSGFGFCNVTMTLRHINLDDDLSRRH